MRNKPDNVIPFTPLTLSEVLKRYKANLHHHDLVIGLTDGNVRIKQKNEGEKEYEVWCHENDVTIPSTLHVFLEQE